MSNPYAELTTPELAAKIKHDEARLDYLQSRLVFLTTHLELQRKAAADTADEIERVRHSIGALATKNQKQRAVLRKREVTPE